MSEDKNQNQDFIEGQDDLADSIDMNFSDTTMDDVPEDDIIDIEPDNESIDFESMDHDDFGDEWAEDFGSDDFEMGDEALSEDDFNPGELTNGRSERNWFNIALFGVLGLVVCFLLYAYVPSFLGGTSAPAPVAQNTQAQSNTEVAVQTPENNAQLAQQAVSPQLTQIEEAGGLLANPELLSDGVDDVQRPDPDADGNVVFDLLADVPTIAENEVEDIFAAINDLQAQGEGTVNQVNAADNPQALPAPADEVPTDNMPDVVFENIIDDTPRSPSGDESSDANIATGIGSLDNVQRNQDEGIALAIPDTSLVTTTVDNEQMQSMNARMDEIMARLEQLAQQVESSKNTPVATVSQDNSNIAVLENTIANLEKKVSDLSKQKATSSPGTAAPKKTVSRTPTYRAPVKASPKWELRGASPGQALVSEIGTQNLRNVSVGDTLNGVGRIGSISQENGRWVVRGTSGQIRQ
jgi:hypothetical protein